jgi:hypothetical protein
MRPDTSEPRLIVQHSVDANTGVTEHRYLWDGVEAKKVQISGALAERIAGLTLIQKDLTNALRWIDRAIELAKPHISGSEPGWFKDEDRNTFDDVKAYFIAALTFYGKCYTEAAGRKTQVSRDWLDVSFRDAHDYYMAYRHGFAAHSGTERFELGKTFVLVAPDGSDFIPVLPTARVQPDIAVSDKEEKGFRDLIEHAIAKVVTKYERTTQKVINELVIPRGVAFWTGAAARGDIVVVDAVALKQDGRTC